MAITTVGYTGTISALQYAQTSLYQGAAVPVVGGRNDFVVTAGSALNCIVGTGRIWAPGLMTTNDANITLTLNAVTTSGATRWDAIVVRHNWSGSGSTTALVVQGTAGANAPQVLPAGVDQTLDATYDVVVALVQVTNGSTIPVIVDKRLWAHKVFTTGSVSSLPAPTFALFGMQAQLTTGEEYRCLTDATNNPAWIKQGGAAATVATTGFFSPASGWSTTGLSNRYMVDGFGTSAQYDLNFQRTGAAIHFAVTSGAITDNLIGTVTGMKPDRSSSSMPVTFRHWGGNSTSSTGRLSCWGYLQNDGNLYIESGIPDAYLNPAPAGNWALTATIQFTRGS